jgi:tetratricopeptide (TPR) repeat protein
MSTNWSQTLLVAEKHLSRGKITAAIDEYRKLVTWDPTDLTTLNRLGDLYARAGLNQEAKRIFSRVADGYRYQGFTLKAIAVLKKLLRIDPSDLESAGGLAECYLAQGLAGDAGRQYNEIATAYERAGQEQKALAACQRLAEIDPSNTSLLMTLGDRWLAEGLKEKAHTNFIAAADQYSRQADDERALHAYLKAQRLHPDEHRTLAAIASICTASGQLDKATPILCAALERNSNDAELYRILGSAYLSAGRLDDAERTFHGLLALDGGEYRNLMIVGEKFLEGGDLDRAVEQIDGIVDLLIANRTEQEAVEFLRKVLDCDPEHLGSLRMLAMIFRRVREDFSLAPTLKALADSAMRRDDRDEAIDALTELCSLEPHAESHRVALQSLGVDAPAISFATYAATKGAWECSTPNVGGEADAIGLATAETKRPRLAQYSFVAANDLDRHPSLSHKAASLLPNSKEPIELVTTRDRRRSSRVRVRVPIVVISETGGWREFTETLDVGAAGLRLRLAHPTPPLTALRVSLEMGKWPDTVPKSWAMNATKCVVRYCRSEGGQSSLIGVELPDRFEQTPGVTFVSG